MVAADGRLIWIHDIVHVDYDDTGKPAQLHGFLMDITSLKQTQALLAAEKQKAQVTLGSVGDAVITTDQNGRVESLNPTAEHLTGWTLAEVSGRGIAEVFQPVSSIALDPVEDPVLRCLAEGCALSSGFHIVLVSRGGGRHYIEYSAAPIRLPNGQILGAVLTFRDVSEARRLVDNLSHQAGHDALTGLANRTEFETRLRMALERAKERGISSGLLYMDLDQFKIVNDSCGHGAGDELLRQVTAVLRGHVRERDTLARLGGDEFALLIEHCSVDEAMAVANKILTAVRGYRFHCDGRSFQVGVSVGVVVMDQASESTEQVLKLADGACYLAKEGGRNRVVLQTTSEPDLQRRQADMNWVSRLGEALDEDQLVLFYQRIVPLGVPPDHARHYEILLRLQDPHEGLISPAQFLPAAERFDLMPALDRWVLQHTCWFDYLGGVGAVSGLAHERLSGSCFRTPLIPDV